MSRAIEIRAAVEADIAELIADLRPEDRDEGEAMLGPDFRAAVPAMLRRSNMAWTARRADGAMVAMFGIVPVSLLPGIGCPWMLGTPLVARHARTLVRMAPRVVALMLAHFPRLENYVDARNRLAIGWLRRMGFKLDDPAPFGVAGLPFHRFVMEG